MRKKGFDALNDVTTEFDTGINLMRVVNALYDLPIPKHNKNPKMRPQQADNLVLAFNMVEEAKIKTNFLKSTHLMDHDQKMILGMIWAIILDYQIKVRLFFYVLSQRHSSLEDVKPFTCFPYSRVSVSTT